MAKEQRDTGVVGLSGSDCNRLPEPCFSFPKVALPTGKVHSGEQSMLHNFAFIGLGLLALRPYDAAAGAAIIGGMMCYFGVLAAVAIVVIAGQWKVFEKAGRPGWAAIIPIYNTWVLLEICEKPGWLVLLCLIPFVGWIVGLYVWI